MMMQVEYDQTNNLQVLLLDLKTKITTAAQVVTCMMPSISYFLINQISDRVLLLQTRVLMLMRKVASVPTGGLSFEKETSRKSNKLSSKTFVHTVACFIPRLNLCSLMKWESEGS